MIDQSEIRQKIWTALNKDSKSSISFTISSRFSDIKLLELIAQTKGIDKLEEILKDEKTTRFLIDRYNSLVPSLYVYNFIAKFTQSLNPKSHLDPYLTYTSPCNFFDFGETVAYCSNENSLDENSLKIINTFFGNSKTQIHTSNRFEGLKSLAVKFDLITSFPPFGLKQQESIKINGFLIPKDLSTSLLIQSALVLNDNGKAIFLVSPSFMLDKKAAQIMNKLGLFVDAVFAIPSGALSPSTDISSNLIVVTKQPKKKAFVAEISANEESNEIILSNYKRNKNGKNISLGVLVDFIEFKSFQSLVAKNALHLLTRRFGSGYEEIPLINLGNPTQLKQQKKEEIEHIYNSIYLPVIGNSPIVTNPSDMKTETLEYFQIQLDESKADATYVASYFNSSIGKKLRESLSSSGFRQSRITKIELSRCILHLPDLSTQLKIIEVDNKINEIYLNVDVLKRELWNQPKEYQSIARNLNNINKEETLEHWIDTLPFPLSSILRLYYTASDNSKKIEHLFHFFEALSEFLSMIMLSSLTQDQDFLAQEYRNSISNMNKDWYIRTSFGNWKELAAILSKATRKYHNHQDKEKKDFCKSLYGNPSDAFLDMLSNKGIINVLSDTNELRNKWKGHGGIVSEEVNKQRLTTLEQHLNKLREFIGEGFDEARIVSPNTSSYESGIFTFNAKELVGVRTPFKEISVRSLIPLDTKKLYLTHLDQNKPTELLPFIKFVERSGAVYFYTSIESKGVRWVSYHFEKESEINNEPPNNELLKAFSFLKNDE